MKIKIKLFLIILAISTGLLTFLTFFTYFSTKQAIIDKTYQQIDSIANIEKKRIWVNLELAKKPEHCLEYIIVHEMVHLLERKHNDRFLYYMETHLPNWKSLKVELNRLPVSHADWKY